MAQLHLFDSNDTLTVLPVKTELFQVEWDESTLMQKLLLQESVSELLDITISTMEHRHFRDHNYCVIPIVRPVKTALRQLVWAV